MLAITGVTAPPEKASVKTIAELVDDKDSASRSIPLTIGYLDVWKRSEWDIKTPANSNSTNVNSNSSDFEHPLYSLEVDSTVYFSFVVESYNELWKLTSKMDDCVLKINANFYPLENFPKSDWPHIRACRPYAKLSNRHRYLVPKREVVPPQFSKSYEIAIERALVKEDEQIVYIDYEEKVKRDHDYLTGHYHHKTFFIGNQSFLKDWTVWQFDNGRGSRLPAIFQLLIQNEIYKKLESFHKNIEFFGVRNEYTRIQAFKKKLRKDQMFYWRGCDVFRIQVEESDALEACT
ncbi:unnamed protein product [Orchesella dallaii]|uniref:Uncharacterized protein n=1 Tax=Orchesella dallaii TaxID=48710 RepID=A0ABP1S974_9HEXA